ncbi:peptidase S28, partial [Cystobasidium minutum MCA 4210]|uniref:peptidase S28 n=1 Tax=Cystobasidium minutum MCA 4210 TaxID=1397322 RepID=UPI0034CD4A06
VPVDHFDDTSNATFPLRFWVDATYYKPGGPVFCLDGGETSGEDRLPFLDHGILKLLSQATNGLSIVLEHRYYGESMPVPDLSTDNMAYLTTAQALADNAYFTKHAKIANLSKEQADAMATARWIHYGGSYAGAKVALLRKLYPETVFGAIASSAVTTAIVDYWKYFEGIRLHADQECVHAIIESVSLIDSILAMNSANETAKVQRLFGVENLTHVQDFVALLTYPLGAWQAQNWDATVSSTGFTDFCDDLLARQQPEQNAYGHQQNGVQHPLISSTKTTASYIANYATYIRENVLPLCRTDRGAKLDECFGTFNDSDYQQTELEQTWRSWTWQYCTEWGYLQNAAPEGVPSLLSRHIDLDYTHQICRQAFPEGKHVKMPTWPNVTLINQYGGFELEEDRIAFIDGSFDPWIYATPHSPDVRQRKSTLLRPFELIKGGVHHWDENSLPESKPDDLRNEPEEIRKVHQREIEFVKSWLEM